MANKKRKQKGKAKKALVEIKSNNQNISMTEEKRIENEADVLAGVKAQAVFTLQYATEAINAAVPDAAQAAAAIAAFTAKYNAQQTALAAAIVVEFSEVDQPDAELIGALV